MDDMWDIGDMGSVTPLLYPNLGQTYDDTVPTYPWHDFQQAHNAPLPALPDLYVHEGGVDVPNHNVHHGPFALQPGCTDAYPWIQSAYSNGCMLAGRDASVPQGRTSLATDIQHSLGHFQDEQEFRPVQLAAHARLQQQRTIRCVVDSCGHIFVSGEAAKNHMELAHTDACKCDQCPYVGNSQFQLGLHASNTGHTSFACNHRGCRKKFTRLDTYQRHCRTAHSNSIRRFPCKYCKKYRGSNGFMRKDHLTQHVRNYHHIGEGDVQGRRLDREWCPKQDCPEVERTPATWGQPGAFASSKDWVEHMRKVHNHSDLHCPQPGCDRVNGKGYFRTADLRAHLRKVHGTDGTLEDDEQ